jgi:hypothetical protein
VALQPSKHEACEPQAAKHYHSTVNKCIHAILNPSKQHLLLLTGGVHDGLLMPRYLRMHMRSIAAAMWAQVLHAQRTSCSNSLQCGEILCMVVVLQLCCMRLSSVSSSAAQESAVVMSVHSCDEADTCRMRAPCCSWLVACPWHQLILRFKTESLLLHTAECAWVLTSRECT